MRSRCSQSWLGLVVALGVAALCGTGVPGCKRAEAPSATVPKSPSLRLYLIGTLAGALEPCGCQKNMLGGMDHMAALVRSAGEVPNLVLGAGPMLFMDPVLKDANREQDLFKAEAIATSLRDVKLSAWTPGLNDWAAGASALGTLREKSGAELLAANLGGVAGAQATRLVEVGGLKVGLAGVSVPRRAGALPEGVTADAVETALGQAADALGKQGAELRVALVALPRGEALRLAEKVTAFQVLVVGKPFDEGDGNDAATPPVLIGTTLVVQPPNHLTGVAVVDLYVRNRSFAFQDAAGVGQAERRASLERRITELEERIATWEKQGGVAESDLGARRADLTKARADLALLTQPTPPASGSFFRYELSQVREAAGSDAAVAERMKSYYGRVNEHNREAFKDRAPPPPAKDQSGYVGVAQCATCHAEETAFWRSTKHASAYATLSSQHKEFNLDCVGCHVTGYEKAGGSTVTHVDKLTDVQCETCHGPGSRHASEPHNAAFIVQHPENTLCAGCHHPPHVNASWSVDEAFPHILGKGHGQ